MLLGVRAAGPLPEERARFRHRPCLLSNWPELQPDSPCSCSAMARSAGAVVGGCAPVTACAFGTAQFESMVTRVLDGLARPWFLPSFHRRTPALEAQPAHGFWPPASQSSGPRCACWRCAGLRRNGPCPDHRPRRAGPGARRDPEPRRPVAGRFSVWVLLLPWARLCSWLAVGTRLWPQVLAAAPQGHGAGRACCSGRWPVRLFLLRFNGVFWWPCPLVALGLPRPPAIDVAGRLAPAMLLPLCSGHSTMRPRSLPLQRRFVFRQYRHTHPAGRPEVDRRGAGGPDLGSGMRAGSEA